jgi:hypothetical protein
MPRSIRFTPRNNPVPLYIRMGGGQLAPIGIWSPDSLARGKSLYRLHHTDPFLSEYPVIIKTDFFHIHSVQHYTVKRNGKMFMNDD